MKILTFFTRARIGFLSLFSLLLIMVMATHNADAVPVSYDIDNVDTLASSVIGNTSHVTNAASDGVNDESYTFSYTAAAGNSFPSNVYLSIDLAGAVKSILSSSSSIKSLTLEFDFTSSTQTNSANQSFTIWGSSNKAASGTGIGTSNVDSWKFSGTGAGWNASANADLLPLEKVVAGSTTHFSIAIDLANLTYSITATNGAFSGTVDNLDSRASAAIPSATNAGSLSYLNILLGAGASASEDIARSVTISNITFKYDDGIVIPEPGAIGIILGSIVFSYIWIFRRFLSK